MNSDSGGDHTTRRASEYASELFGAAAGIDLSRAQPRRPAAVGRRDHLPQSYLRRRMEPPPLMRRVPHLKSARILDRLPSWHSSAGIQVTFVNPHFDQSCVRLNRSFVVYSPKPSEEKFTASDVD